ncbi:MAG: sulfatase-like hydrolase/transferase [Elusimicrobia bacterium]|nr:sulfatase-like hydrolase/transferase [Elusimicrobiota bacterium]
MDGRLGAAGGLHQSRGVVGARPMKIRRELGEEVDLLRRWVLVSGRDALVTTRDSFVSIEGRAGITVFVALWILGRIGAGEWTVWGRELGGELLPVVRTWFAGGMAAFQSVLLGAHLLAGVLWGVIAKNVWGLLGYFWPKTAAERFTPWVVGVLSGLFILILHSALLCRDLARHAALYQETFLDQGGLASWLQTLSLKTLAGPGGTAVGICVGIFVLAATARVIQRLVCWFMGFSRPTRVAIGVLGGAVALFACGIRFVIWTHATRNEGPNLLLISVDGLRAETLENFEKEASPPFARWFRRAKVVGRTVPPSVDLTPTLMTGIFGRSPLTHGVRHDFPSADDAWAGPPTLPALLRGKGWTTALWADGPEGVLDRLGREFDFVHVASSDGRERLARRQLERSPHLLPYLSGRAGRAVRLLRGSPFLADPALLAREAAHVVADLHRKSKFFLWVHFSSPGPLAVAVSPNASAHRRPGDSPFFRRPGDGRTERAMTEAEESRFRGLYDDNAVALRDALDVLFQALADRGLEENTAVVLWSPRATLFSRDEESDARALKGPAFFGLPFLAVPGSHAGSTFFRSGPGRGRGSHGGSAFGCSGSFRLGGGLVNGGASRRRIRDNFF